MFGAGVDDGPILVGQRLAAVADKNHQVRVFHGLLRPLHTHGLDFVLRFPDTCGINEPQPGRAHHHGLLHGIPCGARNLGDDNTLVAGQCVQQAGFTDIGLADNGSGHTGSQDPTLSVSLQQGVERFCVGAELFLVIAKTEILDILVGIIQHGMEMAAQVGQVIVDGRQLLLQHTAHLSGSVGGRIGAVRLDQINDGLRLGQRQLSV